MVLPLMVRFTRTVNFCATMPSARWAPHVQLTCVPLLKWVATAASFARYETAGAVARSLGSRGDRHDQRTSRTHRATGYPAAGRLRQLTDRLAVRPGRDRGAALRRRPLGAGADCAAAGTGGADARGRAR